jgi:hypothetical protein
VTFGGPRLIPLLSLAQRWGECTGGQRSQSEAKSAGGLHVLSPRAFTASHLSLARHERLAVAAIVLFRKARSATVGGRSDTPARTRDDDAIRWAGRLISHDMCHYSGILPTCKVGLGRRRQSGTARRMQHDSSNLSSSSSPSSAPIASPLPFAYYRTLLVTVRRAMRVDDPYVMSASDVRLGERGSGWSVRSLTFEAHLFFASRNINNNAQGREDGHGRVSRRPSSPAVRVSAQAVSVNNIACLRATTTDCSTVQ